MHLPLLEGYLVFSLSSGLSISLESEEELAKFILAVASAVPEEEKHLISTVLLGTIAAYHISPEKAIRYVSRLPAMTWKRIAI